MGEVKWLLHLIRYLRYLDPPDNGHSQSDPLPYGDSFNGVGGEEKNHQR